jgi:16S rRNA A1518/A1519 N6-dimethyltransferase RsmA/KsgA/DIM1 with predicted DNA glycosylase/AP lyase activity
MNAVDRPKIVANLPHAVGADLLPNTRQWKTQNFVLMHETAKRFFDVVEWNLVECV